jgi:8-oxo-dGTP pyrophosphatase MutT (NUDIX family)
VSGLYLSGGKERRSGMIDVVSGVMIRDGRVFLTQRRADQSYPMSWESPGGKVEGGEDFREALLRELEEELDTWAETPGDRQYPIQGSLFIVSEEPFFVVEFATGDVDGCSDALTVHFYLVSLHARNWPVGAEGQGSGWFTIAGTRNLQMLPGNEQARSIIEREIVREGARK